MNYQIAAPQSLISKPILLPTSKSISNRVLIINALAYSPYDITNLSDSDDTRVLNKVFFSNSNKFDIGAAGTSMRFLTAFLAKIVGEWEITGSQRMKQRPISILVDALRKLGANIEYMEKEGFPPLKITGASLTGGELELEGNISSQYISAILMIAPTLTGGLTLKLQGEIISQPYITLTLNLMKEFGIESKWEDNTITIREQAYRPKPFTVEGDWSAASYWYEMLALAPSGEITLQGLFEKSSQGDSKVAHLFELLGVKTEFNNNGTHLTKIQATATNLNYDFTNEPDLAQTFAVTCCLLNIPFHFKGLQTLRIKESDRIYALIAELKKLGYNLTTNGADDLKWTGEKQPIDESKPIEIQTYEDHRMALAFAPAALRFNHLIIQHPSVVTKSYPEFWEHLKKARFRITSIK
jgi:3-phosphoshikimate 1-carboxyvinyltransferase